MYLLGIDHAVNKVKFNLSLMYIQMGGMHLQRQWKKDWKDLVIVYNICLSLRDSGGGYMILMT